MIELDKLIDTLVNIDEDDAPETVIDKTAKEVIEFEDTVVNHTWRISKDLLINDFGSAEEGIKALESLGCFKHKCDCN